MKPLISLIGICSALVCLCEAVKLAARPVGLALCLAIQVREKHYCPECQRRLEMKE